MELEGIGIVSLFIVALFVGLSQGAREVGKKIVLDFYDVSKKESKKFLLNLLKRKENDSGNKTVPETPDTNASRSLSQYNPEEQDRGENNTDKINEHSPQSEQIYPASHENFTVPSGTLPLDAQEYIKREIGAQVIKELSDEKRFAQDDRRLVIVYGPHQIGKSSLMYRIHSNVQDILKNDSIRSVLVDFGSFDEKDFKSIASIWQAIIRHINYTFKLEGHEPYWNYNYQYTHNMDIFLNNYIFKNNNSPLLLCFDQLDSIFSTPVKIRNIFFGSIRYFYNQGQGALNTPWQKVRWLLNTVLPIQVESGSPFNVGKKFYLKAFTISEVEEMSKQHGNILSPDQLKHVNKYFGGQPYLTHLLFHNIVHNQLNWLQFIENAQYDDNVLQHLEPYLTDLRKKSHLSKAFKNIINGGECRDDKLVDYLKTVGLIRSYIKDNSLCCSCDLYTEYFGSKL